AGGFEQFAAKSYGEKISFLADAAAASGKRLIIRDWPTLNFLSGIHWNYFFPSGVLEQDFYLDRYSLQRHSAVVSRRSASVYESLKRSFPHLKQLSVDDFSSAYLAYAQAVASFPVIHFEEFCEAPVREFRRLCEALRCSFSEDFLTAYKSFVNCTGDNNLAATSRGDSSDRILPLTDNRETPAWKAATRDERCRAADRILGYVQ
ncbi:MAG TPA: sulfotransferase family protein, partial [Terriglobia bacterium]|nr:sulfotransferase family protein [Terriglobia bacterium]